MGRLYAFLSSAAVTLVVMSLAVLAIIVVIDNGSDVLSLLVAGIGDWFLLVLSVFVDVPEESRVAVRYVGVLVLVVSLISGVRAARRWKAESGAESKE